MVDSMALLGLLTLSIAAAVAAIAAVMFACQGDVATHACCPLAVACGCTGL